MDPKFLLVTIQFFFCVILSASGQHSAQLSGDVHADLSKNELKATYELTKLEVDNPKMSFMLHEDIDVDQVYLNSAPIASSKNGRSCEKCKVHTIWIDRPITTQDTIRIAVAGDLEMFTKSDIKNSRPRNRIYTADTRTKWYPVVLDESTKKEHRPFAQNTYNYTYMLSIDAKGFSEILLQDKKPNDSSMFASEEPVSNLNLLFARHKIEDFSTVSSSDTNIQKF